MTTLLTDSLWAVIQPLLPRQRRSSKGGAPRRDDRKCLEGILYVLNGGIAWNLLPNKEFKVSATTCWRRFRAWTKAGIWDKVHRTLLSELAKEGVLKTETVIIDSASVRALKGGHTPGPAP